MLLFVQMNDRECEDRGGKTDLSTETHSVQIEAISSNVDQQTILENENASDLEAGGKTFFMLCCALYEQRVEFPQCGDLPVLYG